MTPTPRSADFVAALARKWCRELWGSHSGTEREIPFEDCNTCRVIATAISEALEEAEKIARNWDLRPGHCDPSTVAEEIAAAIAALGGGTLMANRKPYLRLTLSFPNRKIFRLARPHIVRLLKRLADASL